MSSVILPRLSRRSLLATGTAAVGMLAMPAILRAASAPAFTHGVQSGDAHAAGGMVWTRVDRPSRVLLEVSTTESFADPRRIAMLDALPDTDMALASVSPSSSTLEDAYEISNQKLRSGGSEYVFTLSAARATPAGAYLKVVFEQAIR